MAAALKSPIHRMGGKYYLTGWLSQYMPEHVCYVEVFSGAGHLLFSKKPSLIEVLSDVDNSLISFFRVMKDAGERAKLVETLEFMPYSRALWQEMRTRWKAGDLPEDGIEKVAEWFYLNRTCFGGDQRTAGFAAPSVTGRNPVQSFRNAVDSFESAAKRLRNVCIENLSYGEVIRKYDSPGTLFYADPPYLNAEGYYGDSFTQDDHCKLAELLHSVRGSVMLSHYRNSLYDDLYRGWRRHEYQSFKGSHKAEPGAEKPVTTEILYTNFEPFKTRSLFSHAVSECFQ
ncbi:MAG: DNA adenine methylase [Anaerolineae bacterium]|nr:DNA adenine methylase [Anaerolineae bacterium]